MNIRYTTLLTIVFLLLVQGCANTSIDSIKPQYNALNCDQLANERKEVEQKYKKYRGQYSEIKSMWDHGNNDYLKMHRVTDEWKKNYNNARDRLKTIKSVINQKGCGSYIKDNSESHGKVNTNPIVNRWLSKSKPELAVKKLDPNKKILKVNLTGNWIGTWVSTNGKNGGEASATFVQDNDNLMGLFSIKDSPCLKSGTVEGSVSDSYAKMNITSGEHEIVLDAYDVSSRSFKGSYITTRGKCKGSKGDIVFITKN
jgi:hypothetical protein